MTATGGLGDVTGLQIGHHHRIGDGYLTGTTVVLAPPGGMVAGVDVRGGAPGTRETDLLAPTAAVERIHALVLTGGSAYGLAVADGVVDELSRQGVGFEVGGPGMVVPIVPAAVIFDLGRGGDFSSRPDAEFGRAALRAAQNAPADGAAEGLVGAGVGACTGLLKSGVGQASATLADGAVVGALVVVNATGAGYDPRTGRLWSAPLFQPADGRTPGFPDDADREKLAQVHGQITAALAAAVSASTAAGLSHTTIGVVATDAALTKSQCCKLAAIAHDGLARAVNPVHTMFDGDLFFGASTGSGAPAAPGRFYEVLAVAADVVTRAVGRALLAAAGVQTPAGDWPSYADLAPSAVRTPGSGDKESIDELSQPV